MRRFPVRLRVVTLNLLHGAPIPGKRLARISVARRLAWAVEHLAAEAPDVVLVQEASVTHHHGNTAEALARRLGMRHAYTPANPTPFLNALGPWRRVPGISFEEGPAVLSRLPIVAQRVHVLTSPWNPFERRIALEAELAGPHQTFSVYSVHLTAGSRAGRRRQVAALRAAVHARRHRHPVIVGGDFNADEDAPEIRSLTDAAGWVDSFRSLHPAAAGHTCGHRLDDRSGSGGRRIDFLFSVPSRDGCWTPTHSRVVLDRALPRDLDGARWASDHFGVLTEFEAPRRFADAGTEALQP